MKKYISVFEMITRSSIYKVIAILVVMAIAEFATFRIAMSRIMAYPSLEMVVDQSGSIWILGIAFVAITIVLCLTGCNIGSNQGYTLKRLQISERKIFMLQAIYNTMCYVLLWATQLMVLLINAGCYVKNQSGAIVTNQTVFLGFYRNDLMHSVLPLEDTMGWCILIYIIGSCGIAAASFTYKQRRGKIGWELIVIVALTCVLFPRELGGSMALLIVCFCMIFVIQWIYHVIFGKELEQYEADKAEK